MADKVTDAPDRVGRLLGERQCLMDQTGDTLTQGIVKALDAIGFLGLFRDGFVPLGRNDTFVDLVVVYLKPADNESGLFEATPAA